MANIVGSTLFELWRYHDALGGMITQVARDGCYWAMSDKSWKMQYNVCERLSYTFFDNYELSTMAVYALTATGTYFAHRKYREQQYAALKQANRESTLNLSSTEKESFKLGQQAAQSTFTRLYQLSTQTLPWTHANAYYAGFEAERRQDHDFARKVKST